MGIALQITVVGMGLIFASIILLWGLMALLVRVLEDRVGVEAPAETPDVNTPVKDDLAPRAAAVAVAIALALAPGQRPASITMLPPTTTVSAWQAAMRGNHLRSRGPVR